MLKYLKVLLAILFYFANSFPQSTAIIESAQTIMSREILGIKSVRNNEGEKELERPDRSNLPQNPVSPKDSQFPVIEMGNHSGNNVLSPQTVSTTFTGATLTGGSYTTSSFPPDDMGAVGPTQYIVSVNGRIATYNKTTGVADGVINTSQDNFFASVMSSNVGTFTSDPRVRYDRLTKRWIFIIIDVPAGTGALPNRVLIGVSADSIITVSTVFKFFYFQHDLVSPTGNTGSFFDYPTLGVDNNALYIGGNVFSAAGSYQGTTAFVVNKASILGNGSITVYAFRNLCTSSSAGCYTPQGVDNYDPNATEGYLIGVDNASYGLLVLKRITNTGGVPSISSNINLAVSTTSTPLTVPHSGNTGGTNGNLDALDDRLYAAYMMNGHIYTAHNIAVNTSGVAATSGTGRRNGIRWYDIQNVSTTPAIYQSGTIFDNAASSPRFYWNPSVMVNGQGHFAFSFSTAGLSENVNAGTAGRLASDVLATMQTPLLVTSSSTAYNPGSDPGGLGGRRWGDYSYVSLDPQDNMTMWMIAQYCNAANNYGCMVAKLLSPAPPVITSANPAEVGPESSVDVIIKGDTTTGKGFYDPGSSFSRRLIATVDGGITVNSVTYTSPSTIVLNLATVGATNGLRTITVTNPDGQVVTSSSVLTYNSSLPVNLVSFTGKVIRKKEIKLDWITASEQNAMNFEIERSSDKNNWVNIGSVNAAGNSNSQKIYSLTDKNINEQGLYSYRIKQNDINGEYQFLKTIEVKYDFIPGEFSLKQNYPNPFNPETRINYDVAERSPVTITIYDILGNEVDRLVNDTKEPGSYQVVFNASKLSSGIYIYKMQANGFVTAKKLTVLK